MDFINLLSTLSIAFDFSFSAIVPAKEVEEGEEDAATFVDLGSSSSSGSDSQLRWWWLRPAYFFLAGGQFGT